MQNVAFSTTNIKIKRLGSYLVEAGLIEQAHIDVALADQEATGMRFGEILVVRGWIKEQTIEYLMEKIVMPEREANVIEAEQNFCSQRSPVEQQTVFDAFWQADKWVD